LGLGKLHYFGWFIFGQSWVLEVEFTEMETFSSVCVLVLLEGPGGNRGYLFFFPFIM